ncbi:hypothetical protein ACFVAD_03930 [Sutcliffiella sp. NPDC057660]|uniref:hypothetical protein n=1 Tax=Sutcliffiella sp. NPDC057660 TaxID=3346199 RepID=UPI0036C39C20
MKMQAFSACDVLLPQPSLSCGSSVSRETPQAQSAEETPEAAMDKRTPGTETNREFNVDTLSLTQSYLKQQSLRKEHFNKKRLLGISR